MVYRHVEWERTDRIRICVDSRDKLKQLPIEKESEIIDKVLEVGSELQVEE